MAWRPGVTKKLPAGVSALPDGVEIHGQQLRITFQLHGQRCREPLPGISKITKSAITYADNKRKTILTEVREGRFDYAAHFPTSPKALLFSGHGGPNMNRTVAEGAATWLEVQDAMKAKSTSRNYRYKSDHVLARWPTRRIVSITKTDIELFQAHLLNEGLSAKSVNDIFTVVRGVWSDAFHDGVIKTNPLERIKNIERDDEHDHADPFTREELALIEAVSTTRRQDVNMIMFDCWAGLSVSELIALAVEDVDTENWTIRVQRARVGTEYKVPKESARIRTVELIDPAIHWLKRQLEQVRDTEATTIQVRQRDNIRIKDEHIRFLFLNDIGGQPWHAASLARWFAYHLKRASVRHRGPNQCRHTFASQAISSYVPLEWVARQLGHVDTGMVRKHYGRFIPADSRSMAGLVSQMMGFRDQEV